MNLRTLALPLMLATAAFLGSCKKDPCKEVTCYNGGSCMDGSCICPAEFEGSHCEISTRPKFLGDYNANESCSLGDYSYTFTISEGSSSATAIIITNLAHVLTVTGSVSGNSLTIPTQQVVNLDGTPVTVVASGQLAGNILSMSYTIGTGSCTAICTKM